MHVSSGAAETGNQDLILFPQQPIHHGLFVVQTWFDGVILEVQQSSYCSNDRNIDEEHFSS